LGDSVRGSARGSGKENMDKSLHLSRGGQKKTEREIPRSRSESKPEGGRKESPDGGIKGGVLSAQRDGETPRGQGVGEPGKERTKGRPRETATGRFERTNVSKTPMRSAKLKGVVKRGENKRGNKGFARVARVFDGRSGRA